MFPVSINSTGTKEPGHSKGAIQTATPASLPSGKVIRLIAAPFFLGTKMEAFSDRGKNDYYMSHDLEDFIAVIEGREQLLEELAAAPDDLRRYLGETTSKLLENERFLDALPRYVPGDAISQLRVPTIVERLRAMASPSDQTKGARKRNG